MNTSEETAGITTDPVSETDNTDTSLAETVTDNDGNTTAGDEKIQEINIHNSNCSTGPVKDDGRSAAFFTAADVRAMTRQQVKDNFDRIISSMRSDKFDN